MKITCQSCQAKYSIADERVAGKTVKIKCKKCGTAIVVQGNEGASGSIQGTLPSVAATGAEGEDDGGETRVFGNEGAAPGNEGAAPGNEGAAPTDEWTVNISDNDQRTMSTAQIVSEYQRGVVTGDAYVWKDGMADWMPLSGVPELVQLLQAAGPAAATPLPAAATPLPVAATPLPVAAPAPDAQQGVGGTVVMQNAAAFEATVPAPTAAAATAARRTGNRSGGVDVFSAAEGRQGDAPRGSSPPGPPGPPGERRVGERNETSVLFSLSALAATTEGASRGKAKSDEARLDMRPASNRPPPRNNGRAGLDDIMNLGGGIAASPMLAAPSLLAPVVEPPPAPKAPSVPPAYGMPNPGSVASPGFTMPEPVQPKKKTGLIIGIAGAVIVLGGLGVFFATRGGGEQPTTSTAETSGTTSAAPEKPADKPADTAAAPADKPADTAAAPANTAAPAAQTNAPTPVVAAPGAARPGAAKPVEKPEEKPEEKPAEAPAAKPAEKPAEAPAAPAAGGGKEFDRAAALSALGGAATAARKCKKSDGPTGSGKVKVTFAPSGSVTAATVEGPPFAGTPVGGCIAAAFRGARVPPFEGAPVSVSKTVSIN